MKTLITATAAAATLFAQGDQFPGNSQDSSSVPDVFVPVLRGSKITMERTRVDEGVWMPQRVGVRAAAKIFFFFFKDHVVDRIVTYSEYRRARDAVPNAAVPRLCEPDSGGCLTAAQ